MAGKKRQTRPHDLLRGMTFVKLATLHDLALAEQVQQVLRECGVGAVIINDEQFQAQPQEQRADVTSLEGFRIEVPASMIEKARKILEDMQKTEE